MIIIINLFIHFYRDHFAARAAVLSWHIYLVRAFTLIASYAPRRRVRFHGLGITCIRFDRKKKGIIK